jgi:protein-S-isoprenylcysteine O-methyltransferase Ste14
MKDAGMLIKSLAGMLFLLLAMGVAIFLPAGTLKYPPAWVYLAIFFVCVLVITLYLFLFDKHLLKSRLAAGPVAEPTRTQKVIQSLAALAFLGIYITAGLDHRYYWSVLPSSIPYLADAACAGAFVFLFYVFKQNTYLSATIEVQEKQQVISTGLYGFVRHPMYTGAIVLMLFTPLALGSFRGLAPAIILAILIGIRAIDEEDKLSADLAGYKDYCLKVKYRLIPHIF